MPSYEKGDVGLAIGLTFAAGLSTVIGASFAFCVSPERISILPIALAFSAGVMIYVSFVEILTEAKVSFEEEMHDHSRGVFLAHLYASLTFFGGIAFGYGLDWLVHKLGYTHDDEDGVHRQTPLTPGSKRKANLAASENGTPRQCHLVPNASTHSDQFADNNPNAQSPPSAKDNGNDSGQIKLSELNDPESPSKDEEKSSRSQNTSESENKQLIKTSLITALAIGLHNFPEGLATFVSTLADPTLGVSIAVAIAIHNIPEGVAVAMPIYFATGSKLKAFGWSFVSGIAEPIGGLVGYGIINNLFGGYVFGVLFGFTAGIMVYISFRELLPTARRKDMGDRYTTMLVFAGFVVMDISLVLFELV